MRLPSPSLSWPPFTGSTQHFPRTPIHLKESLDRRAVGLVLGLGSTEQRKQQVASGKWQVQRASQVATYNSSAPVQCVVPFIHYYNVRAVRTLREKPLSRHHWHSGTGTGRAGQGTPPGCQKLRRCQMSTGGKEDPIMANLLYLSVLRTTYMNWIRWTGYINIYIKS